MHTPFKPRETLAAVPRRGGARTLVAKMMELTALRQTTADAAPRDTIAVVQGVLRSEVARQLGGRIRRAGRLATRTGVRGRRGSNGNIGGGGAIQSDPVVMFLYLQLEKSDSSKISAFGPPWVETVNRHLELLLPDFVQHVISAIPTFDRSDGRPIWLRNV